MQAKNRMLQKSKWQIFQNILVFIFLDDVNFLFRGGLNFTTSAKSPFYLNHRSHQLLMTGSWVILELEEKAGEMLFNPAFVWSEHTPAGLMNGQGTCLASQSSGWN